MPDVAGGDGLDDGRHPDEVGAERRRPCASRPASRSAARGSPRYTPSGSVGSTSWASARSRALYRSVRSTNRGASGGCGSSPRERRAAGQVEVVGDQDGLADRPVLAQRAGAVGEHDGAAAGGGRRAHAVGDDVRVVALVQVQAPEVQQHPHRHRRRPSATSRPWPTAVGGGTRGGRPATTSVPRQPGGVGATLPPRAEHDGDVVALDARAPAQLGRCCRRVAVGRSGRTGWRTRLRILRSRSVRTIEWRGDHAVLVDQTLLPDEISWLEVRDVDTMIDAIRRLAVRGAPAIGVAGGVRRRHGRPRRRTGRPRTRPRRGRGRADRRARPTAVNLGVGRRPRAAAPGRRDGSRRRRGGGHGARRTCAPTRRSAPAAPRCSSRACGAGRPRVHTHCNAGALACVEWGTALGIVRALHERGQLVSVTADETRPLLQGRG